MQHKLVRLDVPSPLVCTLLIAHTTSCSICKRPTTTHQVGGALLGQARHLPLKQPQLLALALEGRPQQQLVVVLIVLLLLLLRQMRMRLTCWCCCQPVQRADTLNQ